MDDIYHNFLLDCIQNVKQEKRIAKEKTGHINFGFLLHVWGLCQYAHWYLTFLSLHKFKVLMAHLVNLNFFLFVDSYGHPLGYDYYVQEARNVRMCYISVKIKFVLLEKSYFEISRTIISQDATEMFANVKWSVMSKNLFSTCVLHILNPVEDLTFNFLLEAVLTLTFAYRNICPLWI